MAATLEASMTAFNQAVSIGASLEGEAEVKKIDEGIYILYNKEPYFIGLQPNRKIKDTYIMGTCYIIAADQRNRPRSLTNAELLQYYERFLIPNLTEQDDPLLIQLNMMLDALDEFEFLKLTDIYND